MQKEEDEDNKGAQKKRDEKTNNPKTYLSFGRICYTASMTMKEKLLENALQIISKEGLPALTLSRLATKCGIQKASIYYHFASKDDIIASLREHYDNIMRHKGFVMDFGADAEKILHTAFSHWYDLWADDALYPYFRFLFATSASDEKSKETLSGVFLMLEAQCDAIAENLSARGKLHIANRPFAASTLAGFATSAFVSSVLLEEESDPGPFISSFLALYA